MGVFAVGFSKSQTTFWNLILKKYSNKLSEHSFFTQLFFSKKLNNIAIALSYEKCLGHFLVVPWLWWNAIKREHIQNTYKHFYFKQSDIFETKWIEYQTGCENHLTRKIFKREWWLYISFYQTLHVQFRFNVHNIHYDIAKMLI